MDNDNVSIVRLNLSTRALHLLQKMQIQTIKDFMDVSMERFEQQKGTGSKTLDELSELRKKIVEGTIDLKAISHNNDVNEEFDMPIFSQDVINQMALYPVSDLMMSVRSNNCLQSAGIKTMDQLIFLSDTDLMDIPNLGMKSLNEIKKMRVDWIKKNYFLLSEPELNISIPEGKKAFYEELANAFNKIVPYSVKHIYNILKKNDSFRIIEKHTAVGDITSDEYAMLFRNNTDFGKGVERYFYRLFSDIKEYIEKEEIITIIERDFSYPSIRNALYVTLNEMTGISRIGSYYVIRRQNIEECVNDLPDDYKKRIFIDRLNGLKLQEIGDKYERTRERVRQIVEMFSKKLPLLEEDYYASVFKYFDFNRELFYDVFPDANDKVYMYLSIRYKNKKGKNEITRSNINGYTGLYSNEVSDYLDRDEATSWKRKLNRRKVAWRVLILHSGEFFDNVTFEKTYNEFLVMNSLDRNRYSYNERTMINLFRGSQHVVFNKEGQFRYYEGNAVALWDIIDFGRYKDSVISSELIYKDYIDIMEEHDINNGYELFCLLKNTSNCMVECSGEKVPISFRRIPVMIVGNGDEEKQMIKLVKELSPVEYWNFYQAYEERFGIRKESAIANLGSYIERYHVNGKYVSDMPLLSHNDEERISKIISERPLWSINELENIFEKECTESDNGTLNNTTLYNLGYTLNVGYAYSRKYNNVTECIGDCIFSEDLVDLKEINPEIIRLSVFQSYIYSVRSNLEYIEVSPKVYASRVFLEREYGLTLVKIREIQKKMSQFYNEKYFNGNSLWHYFNGDPDIALLKDNKWLCTSIMRQQSGVFSLSIINAVVLSLQKDELSLAKICLWIAERDGKMKLEQLTDHINDIFGSKLDKYKIAFKIKEQGLENEILTDGVDEYLEQLILETSLDEEDPFKEEFF